MYSRSQLLFVSDGLLKLKESAKRRKGRGFGEGTVGTAKDGYESLAIGDDTSRPGPQRCE